MFTARYKLNVSMKFSLVFIFKGSNNRSYIFAVIRFKFDPHFEGFESCVSNLHCLETWIQYGGKSVGYKDSL
jgi:hypothetical protein